MKEYVVVQYASAGMPTQLDITSGKITRSCDGALHFVPGATKELTRSEYEFIKKENRILFSQLRVVANLSKDDSKDTATATEEQRADEE